MDEREMVLETSVDDKILAAIDIERATYRACTARGLAARLGTHHTYISRRLGIMRERGLVEFDSVYPGSIRRSNTTELTVDVEADEPAEDVATPPVVTQKVKPTGNARAVARANPDKTKAPATRR